MRAHKARISDQAKFYPKASYNSHIRAQLSHAHTHMHTLEQQLNR